jgi:hypothetical protein
MPHADKRIVEGDFPGMPLDLQRVRFATSLMQSAKGNPMSAEVIQTTRPGWRFWLLWMIATVVGAAAGMVLSVPLNLILEVALGTSRTPPWTATETALIALLKGAEGGVMGLGMGLGQWLVFRKHQKQTSGWVIATGLALFLQGAFRWSLPYETSPSQVRLLTTLSFGLFLGVCQWIVLRGRIARAGWWIPISIAGWVLALALMAASEYAQLNIEIESLLGMAFFAVSMLVPFAVAGGGMAWLLRQTEPARQAMIT